MTAKKQSSPRFQVGDRVNIRYSEWRARIVELRGPLGPGGAFVYRIRIPRKPKSRYIEVLEDQLIPIPEPPKLKPSALQTTPVEPKPPKIKSKKVSKGE